MPELYHPDVISGVMLGAGERPKGFVVTVSKNSWSYSGDIGVALVIVPEVPLAAYHLSVPDGAVIGLLRLHAVPASSQVVSGAMLSIVVEAPPNVVPVRKTLDDGVEESEVLNDAVARY